MNKLINFGGMEIYDTAIAYSAKGVPMAEVTFLHTGKLFDSTLTGRDITDLLKQEFAGVGSLTLEGRIPESENSVIHMGDILYASAVNTVLDKLGVTDIRTASPEEIFSVFTRKAFYSLIGRVFQNPEDKSQADMAGTFIFMPEFWNDFAILITPKQPNIGVEVMDRLHLLGQIRGYHGEIQLPIIVYGLRAEKDDYPFGVRLEYIHGKSHMHQIKIPKKGTFTSNVRKPFLEFIQSYAKNSGAPGPDERNVYVLPTKEQHSGMMSFYRICTNEHEQLYLNDSIGTTEELSQNARNSIFPIGVYGNWQKEGAMVLSRDCK